jgi:mannose-1-phosphate guanylyltransferase/mannose-6-phosphate isomerase
MKIKPVILCGGGGTRLWPKSEKNPIKQFIDFGGWTLFEKTLERIKNPIFDYPIISTNISYLKLVRKYLLKNKVKKYKIILEPVKKNTSAAILSSVLFDDIPPQQPMIFFPADHLIEKNSQFNKAIINNQEHLNDDNIFIFGIKPTEPSSQYGYFLTQKVLKKYNKVTKFIEKPNLYYAKKIIKKKGYWNS